MAKNKDILPNERASAIAISSVKKYVQPKR